MPDASRIRVPESAEVWNHALDKHEQHCGTDFPWSEMLCPCGASQITICKRCNKIILLQTSSLTNCCPQVTIAYTLMGKP